MTIEIDIFSDVVCPWCFIGTERLDQVLTQRGIDAKVTFHTFLLDPNTPEAGKNVPEMLKQRYGRDPKPMFARVESEARTVGITLDLSKAAMMYPTVRAHTLLRAAIPLGTQKALSKALFEANFLEGKNITDVDTLVDIATKHGFTADAARAVVTDEAQLAQTRAEQQVPQKLGISGAPFFIFQKQVAVSGAQPVEVFNQILDEAIKLPPPPAE